MDFLESRMKNKQEKMTSHFSRTMNPQGQTSHIAITPIVQIEPKKVSQVIVKGKKNKSKFIISDNKDEIINDIIDSKPSYPDVRKALKVYVEKTVKESEI